MEFHELGAWKDIVGDSFFNSELLRGIVMPILDDERYETEYNWYGGKNIPITINGTKEYNDLIGHYFDFPFVDGTVTDTRMVLCVDTNVGSCEGETIKNMYVDIFVICHKDFIKMSSKDKSKYSKTYNLSGNRVDMAVEVVGRLLNGSKEFGLGRLKPISRNPITSYLPNTKFFGKILHYDCNDFMTDYSKRSVNGE